MLTFKIFLCGCFFVVFVTGICYDDDDYDDDDAGTLMPYLEFCKNEGLNFEKCAVSALENIRPYVKDGSTKSKIRSIEDVPIDDTITEYVAQMNLKMYNFKVFGLSDYFVRSVNLDNIRKPKMEIELPKIKLFGNYTLNGSLMQFPVIEVKGKGPISINMTDCVYKATLTSKIYTKNGVRKLKFTNVDGRLKIEGGKLLIDSTQRGQKGPLGSANFILNNHFREITSELIPSIEDLIKDLYLEVGNAITKSFDFDEFFSDYTTERNRRSNN